MELKKFLNEVFEKFEQVKCEKCGKKFTQPQPIMGKKRKPVCPKCEKNKDK